MTSTADVSTSNSSSHPVVIGIERQRSRMMMIAGTIGLLGICLALSAGALAKGSAENARSNRAFGWVAAGACGLIWIPLAGWLYTRKVRAVRRIADSPNPLAHWNYTAEEQALFVTRERERLQWKRKDTLVLAGIFAGIGVVVCGLGHLLYHWGFGTDIGVFIAAGLLIPIILAAHRRTMAKLPERFAGGVIITDGGVLTAKQLSDWGTREAALIEVAFTGGDPGELQFKIRRTYHTQEGTSTSVEDLRVPVPKGRDEEARNLVSKLQARD